MGESLFPGEREGEGEGEGEERLSQNMHFCRKVESGHFCRKVESVTLGGQGSHIGGTRGGHIGLAPRLISEPHTKH